MIARVLLNSKGLSPVFTTQLRIFAPVLLVSILVIGVGYGIYSGTKPAGQNSPDFSLSASAPVSTGTGSSQTSTVNVRSATGFTGQVSLRVTVPPSINCHGITGASSTVIFVPGSWTLQCTASSQGNYPVYVTASSGAMSRNAVVLFRFADDMRNSSTSMACIQTIIVINQTVTCQIFVLDVSPGAKITPAGSVNVAANNNSSQTFSCVLTHGVCSIEYTPTSNRIVRLDANYAGDKSHSPSQAYATITVRPETTYTLLSCTPSTFVLKSDPASCTATVTSTSLGKQTVPTGVVTFFVGHDETILPSICTLENGNCSTHYSPTRVGSYVIRANYSGDNIHGSSLGQFTLSAVLAPTVTSLACNPSTISANLTYSSCTVVVRDRSQTPSSPTGEIQEKCSEKCTGTPALSCPLIPDGQDSSSCSFKITSVVSTAVMNVSANYQGDSIHAPSSAQYVLTITTSPSAVTVSGHATTTDGCFNCKATRLDFVNKDTGVVYTSTVVDATYTIHLTNMQSYDVIMYWTGLFGTSGSCIGPSLNVHESKDTVTINYRC